MTGVFVTGVFVCDVPICNNNNGRTHSKVSRRLSDGSGLGV